MRLESFLKKHSVLSQIALQAITLFIPAIYVGLLVDKMVKHPGFIQAVKDMGYLNLLFVIQLIAIIIGVRLITVVKDAKLAIKGLLETNSRALSFAVKRNHPMIIRSHFKACINRRGRQFLVPVCQFNLNGRDDDDRCEFEVSGKNVKAKILIVRAFLEKMCIAENIPANAHEQYPESLRAVRQDIKAIIACPVMDFDDPKSEVCGTISFDLMDASINDLRCSENDLRAIVRETAETIYRIWHQ